MLRTEDRCYFLVSTLGGISTLTLVFPRMRPRKEPRHVCFCLFFILFSCGYTGRFDDSVIEERRQCSEDLLQFSANIPALYGSQHIQDFFKVSRHIFRDTKHTRRKTINRVLPLIFIKGGDVHDGSELIGPAESLSDFLADSLSDCSSDGSVMLNNSSSWIHSFFSAFNINVRIDCSCSKIFAPFLSSARHQWCRRFDRHIRLWR